jgi:mRNA interferase RelE/StbE
MYQVLFSKSVEKFLATQQKRNRKLFSRLMDAFDEISDDPHKATVLTGNLKGYYSYRVGDYRILFEVDKRQSLLYVEKIEHRREVYR